MKLILHTEGWYDAAHHLDNYDGACKNLHGHTYKVEVWVQGDSNDLDKSDILWDFGKLKNIIKEFDHNGDLTVEMGMNSTAENQCMSIYTTLKEDDPHLKFKVRLYEQLAPKKSYCECGDF